MYSTATTTGFVCREHVENGQSSHRNRIKLFLVSVVYIYVSYVCMYVCMYVYTYVYMYVCMCMFIALFNIYIYIYQ